MMFAIGERIVMPPVRRTISTVLLLVMMPWLPMSGYSTLNPSDPLPMYTAEYPYNFLSELGDLHGRWNMLGLFYPTQGNNLDLADPCNILPDLRLSLTYNGACTTVMDLCDHEMTCTAIIDPTLSDPRKQVGFFSIPIDYRKYGVRFQFDLRLFEDFGLRIQTGVADLSQTVTAFNDLTYTPTEGTGTNFPSVCSGNDGCADASVTCKELIVDRIMDQRYFLAQKLDVCIDDYHHTGAEDTIISLFWQHLYPVNETCEGWPYFLFVPYVALEVVLPTSSCVSPRQIFGLPISNNGHFGIGFNVGMDFDFLESIEVGIQASMTKFHDRCYSNVPVPTNALQAGLFPFKADFNKTPGTNWTFGATLNAHYFLDRLSAYAQFVVISHSQDCFSNVVLKPCSSLKQFIKDDPGLLPTVLTKKMSHESQWRVHVFNLGLTYDISPNAALGFLWQAPIARTNAYRSTTILISTIFRF